MPQKEAKARIKINKMLEDSGWSFFDDENGRANIQLEHHTKITRDYLENLGDNFEKSKTKNGFLDFLLLDKKGFPLIVLEAKSEDLNPLIGKEQARKYAESQGCFWVILSNGNTHYLWNLKQGNPNQIYKFPTPEWFENKQEKPVNPQNLFNEIVNDDYVVLTQKPDYKQYPQWIYESQRKTFIEENKLRFLRPYQLKAIKAIQQAVGDGKDRFLFEMATGTGKTLTSAAIIKLFLRTVVASRVLFLVDRLELETQANKDLVKYLTPDFKTMIFKENRDGWKSAEIVISTIQSFTKNNKYKRIFRADDFDLVISDEAHRSIVGNSRAVFEYFIGYKLGLTATPKDYLKKVDVDKINQKDPRELERRMLLDTYHTFGCDNGIPTFRYSLLEGVKDGFLINPLVVDARTDITTQLLSDEGYTVITEDDSEESEETFKQSDFEKKFFSENTNRVFCDTFLKNALKDPISGEIGKSIIFCVSQNHAAKVAQILNELAEKYFPNKYQSDFAMQVTSNVTDAQQMTVNFANNNLRGYANFIETYKTSKVRVCVTVGMMTTGYDCPDILNLCLMRPIFSPSEFVQIKGRGTRKHNFSQEITDPEWKSEVGEVNKIKFKLFDFFANCEYFEERFNYDEVLKIPKNRENTGGDNGTLIDPPIRGDGGYENFNPDSISSLEEEQIGLQGMKIDRMYFEHYNQNLKTHKELEEMVALGRIEEAEKYVKEQIFDKPSEYYTIDKLRKSAKVDRRITIWESLLYAFGYIPYFKSKDELLEDEFERFDSTYLPDDQYFLDAKNFFKSYVADGDFREIIESKKFALLSTNPNGNVYRNLPPDLRKLIPEYIKDNISLNQFMA